MTTAPDPQEDRTDAYTGGQSIESRLAAEFADIAVLSGAAPVIVVEFPMSDSPGGVIVAAPDRALQRFDHEPYASASERVPLPLPASSSRTPAPRSIGCGLISRCCRRNFAPP